MGKTETETTQAHHHHPTQLLNPSNIATLNYKDISQQPLKATFGFTKYDNQEKQDTKHKPSREEKV